MSFITPLILGLGLTIAAAIVVGCRGSEPAEPDATASVHDFTLIANDGSQYPLNQHAGKHVLLVNTASRCGLTKQYTGLQELHTRFGDQGLVVIGIPANDFGSQEPGSNEDILSFCQTNFGVTFPLMAKISVKGDTMAPLYTYLTTKSHRQGAISWNFTKFLIGPDGRVIERFGPRQRPSELVTAIETALAAAAPAAATEPTTPATTSSETASETATEEMSPQEAATETSEPEVTP